MVWYKLTWVSLAQSTRKAACKRIGGVLFASAASNLELRTRLPSRNGVVRRPSATQQRRPVRNSGVIFHLWCSSTRKRRILSRNCGVWCKKAVSSTQRRNVVHNGSVRYATAASGTRGLRPYIHKNYISERVYVCNRAHYLKPHIFPSVEINCQSKKNAGKRLC